MALYFVSAFAAYGQASVAVVSTGIPKNSNLSDVIEKAADVQLQNQGLTTKSSGGSVDFILVANYRSSNGSVTLELSLRRATDGTTVGDYRTSAPFDLTLDSHVSDAVSALLAQTAVDAAIRKAAAAHAAEKPQGPQSPGTGTGPHDVSQGPSLPVTPPAGGPSPGPLPSRWHLTLGTQGSPMLLVAGASEYFRYGGAVSLFAGAQFPVSRLDLETGLHAGAMRLFPVAGPSEGQVYAFLGGPELRVGTPADWPVRLIARTSVGAAVITVLRPHEPTLAKTDIYLGGGVAAYLRLFNTVFVGPEVGIVTIFESKYPIIAVTPALVVALSL